MPAGDFRPTAPIENLQARADILRKIREFFRGQGLWEVETPALSADTVVDLHIEPISVVSEDGREHWLQTSPEFGMKRLLASGADAIYQIAKCFRADEIGPLHNLEFTMVEWYRVGDDYQLGMQLLAELVECILPVRTRRKTYQQAFEESLGLDPHSADLNTLIEAAGKAGLPVERDFSSERDDWLNLLLSECVQPQLGRNEATLLYDYPAGQAALARIDAGPPQVAQRFELFVQGVELANGYHELLDAGELRRRNTIVNQQRAQMGRRSLPADSRLLDAMQHGLPPCCGCALGLDRLCMLALGVDSIEQVLAFPLSRA